LDVRDTLGEVSDLPPDQNGNVEHSLLPYIPSSEQLLQVLKQLGLRISAITSIPHDWKHEDGVQIIGQAILSQDSATGKYATIGDFIVAEDIREAGVAKPDPRIYQFAAKKFGLQPQVCLFIGENLNEVIGTQNAGMHAQIRQGGARPSDRGPRLAELLFVS